MLYSLEIDGVKSQRRLPADLSEDRLIVARAIHPVSRFFILEVEVGSAYHQKRRLVVQKENSPKQEH